MLVVERPPTQKTPRQLHGLTRTLVDQHGRRRHHRLPQGPRDHRRRLSRPLGRREAPAQPGLQPPDRDRPARGHHASRSRTPPASRSSGIDKELVGQVAATRPRHAQAGALQGQGRPLRRRGHPPQGRQGRQDRRQEVSRSKERADDAGRQPRRRAQKRHDADPPAPRGDTDAAAPGGVPQPQPDLRPGHRRRVGPDARGRLDRSRRSFAARSRPRPRRPSVVGRLVAERAKAAGVEQVVFDRAGFRYHGRIKSLADAAREAGLDF